MDIILRKALRKYNGLRQQLDNVLLGDDGDLWEAELKKFIAKRPCWTTTTVAQAGESKPTSSILEFVSTTTVSATTAKFIAKDWFVVNTNNDAPVKISYLGENFKDWFLNGDGKIEDPISEQTLCRHKLQKSSVDGPIMTELGGEEKSETTLIEMFCLMKKQRNGESGTLLNNGYASIFYIRDQAGVLRAVGVSWHGGGWRVYARSVESLLSWGDGSQVFSRNSVLKPSEPLPATS